MRDGPGLAAWDLCVERMAPLDAQRNAELAREIARERDPEAVAESVRRAIEIRALREHDAQARSIVKLANTPHWPNWAPHPCHAKPGECGTCHGPISEVGGGKRENLSGICSRCGKRLGKNFRRTELGLRLFRAGKWNPGQAG